jgi:hypothetical protein
MIRPGFFMGTCLMLTCLMLFLAFSISGDERPNGPNATEEPQLAPKMPLVYSNSKRIRIKYEVKDVGPSGIASVQLFYTRDGKNWSMDSQNKDGKEPFIFETFDEGRYGFIVVVTSGAGLSGKTPQSGDVPQYWVEVDTTPPEIKLYQTVLGTGAEAGTLNLRWSASDKNLEDQPISLYYAAKPDGPWQPIAENLTNTGFYSWKIPPDAPWRVHVRLKAVDRAGNTAYCESPQPFVLDSSALRGVIVGVEPVADTPR